MLGSLAGGFAGLATGRLLSGIGAVLLSVPLSKMVTDWFAGREIVLAMAIFMNSFPIGIGIAVLVLGGLAGAAGSFCTPHEACSPQVACQLRPEHPARLHEQAAIDRLVRHTHLVIIGEGGLDANRYLPR